MCLSRGTGFGASALGKSGSGHAARPDGGGAERPGVVTDAGDLPTTPADRWTRAMRHPVHRADSRRSERRWPDRRSAGQPFFAADGNQAGVSPRTAAVNPRVRPVLQSLPDPDAALFHLGDPLGAERSTARRAQPGQGCRSVRRPARVDSVGHLFRQPQPPCVTPVKPGRAQRSRPSHRTRRDVADRPRCRPSPGPPRRLQGYTSGIREYDHEEAARRKRPRRENHRTAGGRPHPLAQQIGGLPHTAVIAAKCSHCVIFMGCNSA